MSQTGDASFLGSKENQRVVSRGPAPTKEAMLIAPGFVLIWGLNQFSSSSCQKSHSSIERCCGERPFYKDPDARTTWMKSRQRPFLGIGALKLKFGHMIAHDVRNLPWALRNLSS